MTDNSNIIYNHLNFNKLGDFYFIQIIKRRKDNPGLERDMKLIDNWFIYSTEDYLKKLSKIKEQCDLNNARSYIRLNKRNDKKVALQTLSLVAENIASEQYDIKNCYLSACGQYHSDDRKTWVVDIDTPELELVGEIESYINELYLEFQPKTENILYQLPSKSGIHIICSPFNVQKFKQRFPAISIHKDNPTILYENIL